MSQLRSALRAHWPEYLIEAGALAAFMISACVFGVLLWHPASPAYEAVEDPLLRRVVTGLAMGVTAVALICSPWGRRSGAHMNPAFTLSFWMLGKLHWTDAAFYIAAQFAGGVAGVLAAALLIGGPLRHMAVNYVVTKPGVYGEGAAFAAETIISMLLMGAVLSASNSRRWTRYTPFLAGALLALFISFEEPYSGMSMNPARTFGSAFSAQDWTGLWIYFTAPPLGMLLAGQVYRFTRGSHRVFCAKLHHYQATRCIFHCNYGALNDD